MLIAIKYQIDCIPDDSGGQVLRLLYLGYYLLIVFQSEHQGMDL